MASRRRPVSHRAAATAGSNGCRRRRSTAGCAPPAWTAETDDVSDRAVRDNASRALGKKLKARFREYDVFVEVYDPSRLADEDVEPIERTLSSELVEVDEDMAEAIALLDEDRADALWEVRWAFETTGGNTRSRASGLYTSSPPTASSDRAGDAAALASVLSPDETSARTSAHWSRPEPTGAGRVEAGAA
jgi:hypothetical protein